MSQSDNELFDGEYRPDEVPVVRSPWSRLRVQSVPIGESMTLQSEKDLTDINYIVKQFDRSGDLPPGKGPGQYIDVTMLNGDLLDVMARAQEIIDDASAYFQEREDAEALAAEELAREQAELLERAKAMMSNTSATVQPSGGTGASPPS